MTPEEAAEHIDWCEGRNLDRGEERWDKCRACFAVHAILGHEWDANTGEWITKGKGTDHV